MRVQLFLMIITLGFAAACLNWSCSSNVTPTTPSNTPTATFTPTVVTNPTGPIIQAWLLNGSVTYSAYAYGVTFFAPVTQSLCEVMVADYTGTTGTANTSATIVAGSTSLALTYVGLQNNDIPPGVSIAPVIGGLYQNSTLYFPGQAYTFNVNVGGTTYSASTTAIGGSASFSTGTSGVTCAWTGGGNSTFVGILPSGSNTFINDWINPTSLFAIPSASFTNETPGAGGDLVVLTLSQINKPAFPNANPSSCTVASQIFGADY